tara:strand:- start:6692 stop:6883 length:192 start_codon:yes stop_codon:yes gene_type:complete
MTEEVKEIGRNVDHCRKCRLLRQNGLSVVITRKHKIATVPKHKFNIAPKLRDRDLTANRSSLK